MRIATLLTTLALAVLSTTAAAQSVSYDYDKEADFSSLTTYAWTEGFTLADELNHKRVVTAIEAQLGAKGMRRAETGEVPDVFVTYHASFDRDVEINGFQSGWATWRFGTRTGSARVEEILKGTLVVDLIDADTKSLVWRGRATKEIDVNAKADKRDRNMTKTAEKLFKDFPPAD